MAQSDRSGRVPGVLSGYLPLIIGAVLFVGMVLVIPSEVPEGGGGSAGPAPESGEVGVTASGFGETVELCEDRELQTESVYSPPCFTFTGDNGGETSTGVTADTIDVTYRFLLDGHLLATLGALAGIDIDEDAEDLYRTVDGLVDYFNQNFEFYGRQIRLDRFDAVGSSTQELSGGGRDLAQTDALTSVERQTFADVGNGLATSQVYSEILASEGIVTIGAAYMSREWFDARGPHAWSMFPDCTRVAEINAQVGIERLLAEPAVLAGGDLQDEPRRMSIIHPNQAEYTQCADLAIGLIEDAGFEPLVQNYTIDLAATESTAASIMAQLRDNDITSVACACDPLMQRALAVLAEQQGYYPEWLIQGVGYIDIDLVGQMIASTAGSQWDRAFGGSPTAASPAWGTSEGYLAYTSVRDDQPSRTVDILYGQLYRLAIGIQMAGPELTADTFATGMYNYPGGTGYLGSWDFSPGNHTGVIDARMVRWRSDLPSTFNGELGTYHDSGVRFTDPEDLPTQDELLASLEGS
jgi:Periplasmic binding protein